MRTISPSELTDWSFCQKYWYHKRQSGLVSKWLTHRDLAAMMGSTVGWYMEEWYGNKDLANIIHTFGLDYQDYFWSLVNEQRALGRVWDYGIDESTLEKVIGKIEHHCETLLNNEETWLQGAKVIACEPIMREWGEARQDMILEGPTGEGIVLDFKCKYSDKVTTFATGRDIDLYGNQSLLYPIAWNSQGRPPKITKVRFVYVVEGKLPIVEDVVCNPKRQAKWLAMYDEVCQQIYRAEQAPHPVLLENPYHMTPYGPCEFREYCASGEHEQGVLNEFIQVERKEKG